MKKNGFTLVELIVVIAIIGILSAVLVPSIVGYIDKANKSKSIQNASIRYSEWLNAYAYFYGKEEKDYRYGITEFTDIEGHIDILGISPCNDEQLYIRLWQNTKLRACNYFYYERKDAVEIRKHIKGMLERHITDRDVKRFWASFK